MIGVPAAGSGARDAGIAARCRKRLRFFPGKFRRIVNDDSS
jgi:hypothetical protein